ncbi:MAG: sigma-54-dependent Fis family transcriptional regulator [Alphaproteobacteria bacterium]|nr:sigma-54-dependent Fis family transcriptional regulator [Alphaproteobacteria bacterium]MAS46024.1 sigma-54-dependent Fis family transcriptional regulator [Alphaproteobacteria bacterium]MAX95794.1 sigma-54-dependent Fis family transcriptional regulator [Alphaproteobacteria bacterium]MBN54072.1 sigma-54-dependent Fis family transcriptional regulator [Alphaproteobacteria bacterium]OUT42342.1 MAG: sigma-54-dependent Fis family transcriptional regulator [Micavibrio sp. TMED2]|tara:strand:- start:13027 stop:14475 length:1449 start_codon:yes stop_codon:yes gene_type:complete
MAHDILIVDDEADIRTMIADILQDEGYEVRQAADADQALEAVKSRQPSLVILDIWLEGSRMDGLGILEILRHEHPGLPVLMISGHGTVETAVAAIKKGAYDFIEKPFKTDRLLLTVDRAVEAAKLRRENRELRIRANAVTDLIGKSSQVNHLKLAIERVAPTNSRVLITGAPGSGKEVVARVLHEQSRRKDGPFVVLNCAIMRPEHFEVELFGAEQIAEGQPHKIGLLEQAHGGTLLLDEIADLPLETQGKIVRVLQEQTFHRVGGTQKIGVDVRVIASSNRNLQEEMQEGRMRQDLYYRLNVVPLEVPALQERRDDIPVLLRHFMNLASETTGLPAREIGDDAMAALQAYEWPGNVRQLRNVIDWLLIMAAEDPIRADMLPGEIGSSAPDVVKWERGAEIMSLPLREAREVFEREYLMAQVNRFGGNISRTASYVGMERSALHRKLKSLGVQSSDRLRAKTGGGASMVGGDGDMATPPTVN